MGVVGRKVGVVGGGAVVLGASVVGGGIVVGATGCSVNSRSTPLNYKLT